MTTQPLQITTGNPGNARGVASLLTLAFHDDPVSSWVFPDTARRRHQHPLFFRTFVDHALMWGEVELCQGAGYLAAALWLEVDPSDVIRPADDTPVFRGVLDPESFARLTTLLAAMEAAHPSDVPHAYLTFVGVSPNLQGQGIGRALLEHKLNQLTRIGRPAYLEASSLRSRELYLRLGFRDLQRRIEVPGGPTLFPMWWTPGSGVPNERLNEPLRAAS